MGERVKVVVSDGGDAVELTDAALAWLAERGVASKGRWLGDADAPRHHPALVEMVETLYEGGCVSSRGWLAVEELPPGCRRYLLERVYDGGPERVVTPGGVEWVEVDG